MDSGNKLWRRFRRDVTRSPKKVAVLGLLLIVALWFWTPLVTKWLSRPDAPGAAPANDAAAQNTTSATTSAAITVTPTASPLTWKAMLELIKHEPRMQPQMPAADGRNPFAPSAARQLAQEAADRAAAPPHSLGDIKPEDAGLVLRSTIVSYAKRSALINERVYGEGQIVVGTNEVDQFELVKISPRYVVLRRNGTEFKLKLRTVEVADLDDSQ